MNPGNRHDDLRLHVLGEEWDRQVCEEEGRGEAKVGTTVLADHARSVINRVDSADLPMKWTLNPYRGCEHGCVYCYARPDHERLGMSCGLDFETKIMAKHEAPELLRKELAKPGWAGEPILMSGVTDPYQPIERTLRITRRCLEVMAGCGQAVTLITKNRLITRDLDVLAPLIEAGAVHAAVSLTTLDAKLAGAMEPRASSPRDRLAAMRELSAAGVPVRVMTAPIIPGLNDRELPALLEAAAEAGATSAGYVLLRLPYQLKALFEDWLRRTVPDRAEHVLSLLRQSHDGKLYDATPGLRQRGQGAMAETIGQMFRVFRRKYGLDGEVPPHRTEGFRRPTLDGQGRLFG